MTSPTWTPEIPLSAPIGSVIAYAGYIEDGATFVRGTPVELSNWKKCDGSALKAEEFPELYAVIRDKFGNGADGASFCLPKLDADRLFGADAVGTEAKDGSTSTSPTFYWLIKVR